MTPKFSIILLGSSGTTCKKIHCSRRKLIGFTVVTLICVCAIGYGLWDYVGIQQKIAGRATLERRLALQTEEIIHQREQIQKFAGEINELKERLVQLDQFEERIRVVANLDRQNDGQGLFGVGGSTPDDLNPGLDLTQRHRTLIKDMHQQIGQLDKASENQMSDFQSVLNQLEARKNLMAHTPAIRPAEGWISSRFGYRVSPFTGKREFHKGWDIANRKGTKIVATADGVVTYAGKQGLFGLLVVIDHGHGITTRYAHLDKALFKRGDRVKRGNSIALMGNSGRSTGPHLHYEVRLKGVPVNPAKYILN